MNEWNDEDFYRTPLQERFLKIEMEEHESLSKIRRRGIFITDEINFEIERRINGIIDNFVTLLIRGEQGTFKTSCALEFCRKIDPKFTIQQVSFVYEHFINKLKESKPKQSFELDEEVWQHGTGSVRIVHEVQSLIETLRKRQNSMIIACTTDKYFPEDVFTFYMKTIDTRIEGICHANKEIHEIRNCTEANEQDHEIIGCYVRLGIIKKNHYIGFYVMPIIWNDPQWKEYSIEKDKFLEQAITQNFSKFNYEKEAKTLMALPESTLYKKRTQIKLLIQKYYPNLTNEETDLLTEQIRMYKKMEEENDTTRT